MLVEAIKIGYLGKTRMDLSEDERGQSDDMYFISTTLLNHYARYPSY